MYAAAVVWTYTPEAHVWEVAEPAGSPQVTGSHILEGTMKLQPLAFWLPG